MAKKKFVVIGIYKDNQQRYADTFMAFSADEAADMALKDARENEGTELIIAGIVQGACKVVA